ncbi:MAG: class I SAM-dependent methyltransferase, partial [Acidobacteriota bacterium]|nr:class I SAM-dependent methyltransferase [Acidobacteriota bacterium]
MQDPKVLERMRADWNQRAGEDAYYYVAFGRRGQDEEEFFATASDVVRALTAELQRVPSRAAALEIGCGPGRLMRPMAAHFREIHGVDVSDEMIRLAAERLRDTPNARVHHGGGSDLNMFAAGTFDFVYSYAVFQHIPSREVVFDYLREARRVLKDGGVLRCQVNGLPAHAREYDTWSGVRISPEEIREFARRYDLQLLAIEQIGTQYMWITCRKRPNGWRALPRMASSTRPAIRNLTNAVTGEGVAPASGPMAALSLWVHYLPPECDLLNTRVLADGAECRVGYIGEPDREAVTQINASLPAGVRTGLVPIELHYLGEALCPPQWMRIMPAAPGVPRIAAVTDGINLLSGPRILTRTVKVTMLDVTHPETFHATVDGMEAPGIDSFCTDPVALRYEFNFTLPPR